MDSDSSQSGVVARFARLPAEELERSLRFERGTLRDYQALAQFHYRGSHPGAAKSVFRVVHEAMTVVGRYLARPAEREIAAVLVISLPHLSCALRTIATGGRYAGLSRREAAAAQNRELRTISRVIVEPRWRGCGLAVRLVRHALANPDPHVLFTEALAAMGRVHPFFDRAGMTRYERPPDAPAQRLLDVMAHVRFEPQALASRSAATSRIESMPEATRTWFCHELRRFAGQRRGCSHRAGALEAVALDELLDAARQSLLSLPVYFFYQHHQSASQTC